MADREWDPPRSPNWGLLLLIGCVLWIGFICLWRMTQG